MPLRNEGWIVGVSLRVALMWNDAVVVLLHCCTDNSAEIVAQVSAEHPGRVHVIVDNGNEWSEMSHRDRLLNEARRHGATHCSIVDCDEILTGNLLPVIREAFASIPPGGYMDVGMPCVWRSLDQYRGDGRIWANRFDLSIGFRDAPALCWKTLNGYDHHNRAPHNSRRVAEFPAKGGVMHLQWASWPRLVAKHRLYKVMERVKYPQKPVHVIDHMYSQALDERGLQLIDMPPEWWAPYAHLRKHADLDAIPWQDVEADRMIAEHGDSHFAGLNLFREALV